jgi:glyoxylase-like metal-dependent hydrolase (beta-lactamase superfamily II)
MRCKALILILLVGLPLAAQVDPFLPVNKLTHVSDHVYVIPGWPNIAIVVGARGTLVVDTGLGPRNGMTVLRQVEKLAKSPNLYLTTTHFHAEHSSGAQAFPARTVVIRPAIQQQEMDRRNTEFVNMFRGLSPQMKELLDVRRVWAENP